MLTNSGVDEFVSDDTLNYYADRSAHCILSFVILQLMEYTIYDYLIAIHSE